jgi:hypothetical protein
MSKSSKYVLAAGCSFTDPNFESVIYDDYDASFTKWPEIFADYLDLPVKNFGRSGVDNTYIFQRLVEDIAENHDKIEIVLVGWTELHRYNIFGNQFHNPASWIKGHFENRKKVPYVEFMKASEPFYHWMFTEGLNTSPKSNRSIIRSSLENLFVRMSTLQKLCEIHGIKHLQAGLSGSVNRGYFDLASTLGVPTFWDKDHTFHAMMSTQNFHKVNGAHVIGWPFLEELGGKEFNFSYRKKEWQVGENDPHPNEIGHQAIAQLYIDKYNEIYV